jgi:hypothetical protein
MPQVNVSQLIGKTFYPRIPIPYFDVYDVNNDGDKAMIKGFLKQNESFVMDSYLSPKEAYTSNYGIKYAKRSNLYLTFYRGNKYYGIIYTPFLFSLSKLQDQGVKTVEEERKQQEEENKTPIDKITDVFKGGAGMVKNLLYIGVAIFAIGYLVPKFNKK